jgi:hypothetical protein
MVRPPDTVAMTRPCTRTLVERRVLGLAPQLVAVDLPGVVGVEHHEIGRRALGQAATGRPNSRAGVLASSWNRPRQAEMAVVHQLERDRQQGLEPMPPGSAWAKGTRLLSWSCGRWSDTMASMMPAFRPSTTASRSFSDRSGGTSLPKVR